jgi:hypothetical protein
MGNQFIKRKSNLDPLMKITSNNRMNDIDTTTPSSLSNQNITDLTLRNVVWGIIDRQKDYDIMSDFTLGTITSSTTPGVLPVYQAPVERPPDPASSQNIFGTRNDIIYINKVKAYCTTATDDPVISKIPNVVGYPLPYISDSFSTRQAGSNIAPPDRKFDDSTLFTDAEKKIPKYPIPLSDIIALADTDAEKLKKLQELAPIYNIAITICIFQIFNI